MKRVVSVGDMRRLEQAATEQGLSYRQLMDNAGTAAAALFEERFPEAAHVLILCGNGNNGGDGFVMANRLVSASCRVTVLLMQGEPQTALAKDVFLELDERVAVCRLMQEDDAMLSTVTHVVDAVYGIGFHGVLPTSIAGVFDRIRETACPVLAVDIPSGVRADDGTFDPKAIQATVTVTFTAPKPCMLAASCYAMCGEVTVASVGIDDSLCEAFETAVAVTGDSVKAWLPRRTADSHKGMYGRLLSVCGSYGMAGAALLAGRAALRMGLGLLHMAIPAAVYPIAASNLLEAVWHPLGDADRGTLCVADRPTLDRLAEGKTAVLAGCGVSRGSETQALLLEWVTQLPCPLLLDADGLNAFSEHIDWLKARTAPTVITPHPAEAARLLGQTVTAIERDRFAAAKELAMRSGAVTVLKGHRTLIALPDGAVYLNETGCSGLATGGSGDVLSGMIASLLAQGVPADRAAYCGVYLHGLASEVTARRLSETAMLPSDMLEDLAPLLSQFETRE